MVVPKRPQIPWGSYFAPASGPFHGTHHASSGVRTFRPAEFVDLIIGNLQPACEEDTLAAAGRLSHCGPNIAVVDPNGMLVDG